MIDYSKYSVSELEKMLLDLEDKTSKEDKKRYKEIDLYLCFLDNKRYEKKYLSYGYKLIAGVDEVGRGPLVGPVVAAAVILPNDYFLEGLTDSKKLSEKKREYFAEIIKKDAISYGIGEVDNNTIDKVNIYEATKIAMQKAIENLDIKPDVILTDAMRITSDTKVVPIIKGDLKSQTISAASVLAKVYRDNLLKELDSKYPVYNFKNNKGYPTKDHIEAIKKYGITDLHRKTYAPIKNMKNTNYNVD